MKRLLSAFIAIVILLAAVGLYRGWFVVSGSSGETGEQNMNVNVTVDQEKVQEDVEAVKSKAAKVTGSQP